MQDTNQGAYQPAEQQDPPFGDVPLHSLVTFPFPTIRTSVCEESHAPYHSTQPSVLTENYSTASYPSTQASVIAYAPKISAHLLTRDDAKEWGVNADHSGIFYNNEMQKHYYFPDQQTHSMFLHKHQEEAFEHHQSATYENCY